MSHIMRAIRLDETGGPENLHLAERPRPELAEDGVLIRVSYAGVIYADAEARRGTYYKKTALPWHPGREAAGVVHAVGPAVREFRPGDRVAALVMGGGCYAEYVQARTAAHALPGGGAGPPSDIHKLPDTVSFTQALVYLINFRLAHLAFHAWAKPPRGAHVLIHGAAGGMGAMLMELARAHACEISAIVRGPAEAAFCQGRGAARVIDAAQGDYAAALRDAPPPNYSFNGVGGPTLDSDCALLAPFGELVCYGYVAGKLPLAFHAIDRTLAVKSFNADNFLGTPAFAEASRAMHERFAQGGLTDVGRVFPLAQAAAAHRALEAGDFLGKIALHAGPG